MDIASLDTGRATLTDGDLREAMTCAPKGSLIIIEDVDAVFTQREGGEKRSGVSFSGLLNAIDGVAAQEGRALVMTTNRKERSDPALVRPGRADVHTALGLVSVATARRLTEVLQLKSGDLIWHEDSVFVFALPKCGRRLGPCCMPQRATLASWKGRRARLALNHLRATLEHSGAVRAVPGFQRLTAPEKIPVRDQGREYLHQRSKELRPGGFKSVW